MPDSTESKVVLITGAAKRIGRTLAADLAARGWCVAIHHRTGREDAERLVQEIAKTGGSAVAFGADLFETKACARLIADCTARFGRIDCLINNASIFEEDSLESMTPKTWNLHSAINLRAPVFLAQGFAAQPLDRDCDRNIINIIDQRVWKLTPQFFSYTMAKAGLWSATRTMAQALAPRIRVNAIGPGPTLPSPRQSPEDFARQEAAVPLGRGTTPDEISRAVRFILESPSMTGQMIALDGGQHLAWQTPDVTGAFE